MWGMKIVNILKRGASEEELNVLARYSPPPWVLKAFFIFVGVMIAFECVVVFLLMTPETVMRLQTLHGGVVLFGGLIWAVIVILLFMQPFKLLSARTVVSSEKTFEKVSKALDELKENFAEIKGKMDDPELRKEFKDAVQHLRHVSEALTKPIHKPPLPPEALGNGRESEPVSRPADLAPQQSRTSKELLP